MRLNSSYTRRSLAMLYFPDCEPRNAVRRQTGMIKRCTDLYEQLTHCCFVRQKTKFYDS